MKPQLARVPMAVWFLCFLTFCWGNGSAAEYTLKGVVQNVPYDTNGVPLTVEASPEIAPNTTCDFVWYRKGEKWRLDIKYTDSNFPQGYWKSIMPFSASELISVVSYPPRSDVLNSVGNAAVTVMTNKFLAAEDVCGAHVVWLTYNLDQALTMFGPAKKCPPFWDYDSATHTLPVGFHLMIPTNGSVIFFNPGHQFARDTNQNVIWESGRPKLLPLPVPLDKGYVEAEFRPSVEFSDQVLRIPKRAEFKYWTPLRDGTKSNGMRMAMLSKLTVESLSLDSLPIPESTFAAAWTNLIAQVTDFRATVKGATGTEPLIYMTKSGQIDPSKTDLIKHELVSTVYGQNYPIEITASGVFKRYRWPVLLGAVVGLLILGLWWFRSQIQSS